MQLKTFTDMALLDQGMRSSSTMSNNEGLTMAMMSMHEGSSQKPGKEDGLIKVRFKNEPERAQMRRVVSLPVEEIASLEEYSSAEEVILLSGGISFSPFLFWDPSLINIA